MLPNLSFNLDEGVVIGHVTIAIVTARVAAWKMEESEFHGTRDVSDRPTTALQHVHNQ